MSARDYDSTVARIAGNIASGMISATPFHWKSIDRENVATVAVELARAIVAETKRTDPGRPVDAGELKRALDEHDHGS